MPEDHKSVTISHETGRVVFWRDSPIFMPSALPQIPRRKIMMKLVRKLLSSLGYRLERITLPEGDLWGGNPLEDVDMYRRLYPTESVQGKRFFNVGAGAFRHPAWTNIDMKSEWYGSVQHANAGGFLEYDLLALAPLPVETDSAELLYSSHTLEHIPDGAAFNLLREAHRVLKPGGVIRLTMPDIDLFYDALRRNDVDFWYQRHTYSIETFWRRVGLRGPMSQFSIEQSFVDMICTFRGNRPSASHNRRRDPVASSVGQSGATVRVRGVSKSELPPKEPAWVSHELVELPQVARRTQGGRVHGHHSVRVRSVEVSGAQEHTIL
jgi:SAM-dependent methyltransferase